MLETLVDACITTSRVQELRLKEGPKWYGTRPQLHLLLIEPFGLGKTTLVDQIRREGYGVYITEFTRAAIVGTISRSGELLKGFVLKAGGDVLLCDELGMLTRKAKLALLKLLEKQEYSRSLGFKTRYTRDHPLVEEDEYTSIICHENSFTVKSKFSAIFCGMLFERKDQMDLAFLSRMFPLFIRPSWDDTIDLILGKGRLDLSMVPEEVPERVEIPQWRGMVRIMDRKRKDGSLPFRLVGKYDKGFFARCSNDLARLAAYRAILRGEMEASDDDCEWALKFMPLYLYNSRVNTLSIGQYRALSILDEPRSIEEAAEILEVSRERSQQFLNGLHNLGLVRREKEEKKHLYRIPQVL